MIWLLCVFIAASLLLQCVFALVIRGWYRSERQALEDTIRAFVTSPGPDQTSPLGIFVDNTATLFASRLLTHIRQSLGGIQSGVSRSEATESLEEAAQGSPLIALASLFLPKRIKNQLARNPMALGALSKLGGNHGSTSSGTGVAARKHRE